MFDERELNMRSGVIDRQIKPFAMAAQMRNVTMQQTFIQKRLRGFYRLLMIEVQALRVTGLKLPQAPLRVAADA